MPAFADTKIAISSPSENRLEALFKAISSTDRNHNPTLSWSPKGAMAFTLEAVMGRWQAIGFAERFGGRYGLGIASIPWCGAANPCPRVSIFALSIPRGSSKHRTELESDLMAEVMACATLKSTKPTSR